MHLFLASSTLRPDFLIEAADAAAARRNADLLAVDGEHIHVGRNPVEAVADEETAWDRFAHHVADEECRDNYRSAYADDAAAVAEYDAAREDGCCGSSDMAYLIAGRLFFIGCNYGH